MKRYQQYERRPAVYEDYFAPLSGGEAGKKIRLDTLRPYQSLNIDKFLALLNKKVPAKKSFGTYAPPLSVSEILRGWVDEWLDSGRDKTGAESPMWRSFKRAQKCGYAAVEYSQRARVGLIPNESGLVLSFPEYKEPSTESLRPLFGTRDEDYAREQLVLFLLTGLRFMLAKCRKEDCGTYFVLRHWNHKYKDGTLCVTCGRGRSLESAKAATASERDAVRGELYQAAGKRFGREIKANPLWYRDDPLKKKIADFLNAQFGHLESFRAVYPKDITGKWVANALNWNPIQKVARKGK